MNGIFRLPKRAAIVILVIVVALVIRFFVVEAFRIPSASMLPTLLIGDHIFINKLAYGVFNPLTRSCIYGCQTPRRGDVIVFLRPDADNQYFIKRVVGLPGDTIRLSGEDLYVSNVKQELTPLEVASITDNVQYLLVKDNPNWSQIPFVNRWKSFHFFNERLGEVNHVVQYEQDMIRPERDYMVPEGHVFAMGDNRDNSSDSREWGMVPLKNITGRAAVIWLSRDHDYGGVRWHRIGDRVR